MTPSHVVTASVAAPSLAETSRACELPSQGVDECPVVKLCTANQLFSATFAMRSLARCEWYTPSQFMTGSVLQRLCSVTRLPWYAISTQGSFRALRKTL